MKPSAPVTSAFVTPSPSECPRRPRPRRACDESGGRTARRTSRACDRSCTAAPVPRERRARARGGARDDRVREATRALRRYEDCGLTIIRDLPVTADCRRDHRFASGHGLEQRNRKAFPEGRQDDEVGRIEKIADVGAEAEDPDEVTDAELVNEAFERVHQRTIAGEDDADV